MIANIEEKCALHKLDYMLAALAGLGAFVAYWLVCGGMLDPSQWDEMTVVSRLMPPRDIFPGYWRGMVSWMFPIFGITGTVKILSIAGAAVGGICVMLAYFVIRQTMAFLLHTGAEYPVWHKKIAPYFSLVAAVLIAAAHPLWGIFQTFSSDSLKLLMVLFTVNLWLRWMAHGGDWRLYSVVALTGLITAETPFGLLLPVMFLLGYFRLWGLVVDEYCVAAEALHDPETLPKWRMFFLFLGAIALGVWINVNIFANLGGADANGWAVSDLYFRYGLSYGSVFLDASTVAGWVLGLGFCAFPFVVVVHMSPYTVGDDSQMMFRRGVILVFLGALAAMQTGAFPGACFWAWRTTAYSVPSGFLLASYVVCAAFAVALVGALFAFECQRFYQPDDEPRPGVKLRYLVPTIALCIVALALSNVRFGAEHEMARIVNDAIEETLKECEGAKWIFTDGHLDSGIRLRAAAESNPLKPLNMMSSGGDFEKFIRERDFPEDSIDRENVGIAVPTLFRVWGTEKPGGLDESAVQLGFELWKRDNKPLPRLSGLVARTSGMDEEQAKRGIAAAEALAQRVLDVAPDGDLATPSAALVDAFSAVSWRLSRIARFRNEEELADMLDESNTVLKRMLALAEYERQRAFMMLTPMEGLMFSLRRADFTDAMRYAPAVLRSDEDSPEGNFAMGMGSLKKGRMDEAEYYLRRVLVRRPNEPAVLNNLSILCRKADKLDEAVELAEKALAILPNSDEVKRTLKEAKDARDGKAAPKNAKKKKAKKKK